MSGDVQAQWETYYYRVSFNDEGLDTLQPTKTPYKYTVYIDETLAAITTEVCTFWLVDITRQDRFFLYENSLQGWETLRCNGDMEASATVAKTEAANTVQAGYAATDAVVKQKSQGYADRLPYSQDTKPRPRPSTCASSWQAKTITK
jgi:hypothetical protein